jgi:lipoprotein-releasing system permease protein
MTDAAMDQFTWKRWREEQEAADAARGRELDPPPPAPPPGKNPFGAQIPVIEPQGGDLPPELKGLNPDVPQPSAAPLTPPGIVIGWDIGMVRVENPETHVMEDVPLLRPGDDLFLATVGASGTKPVSATFVVTDYFRSRYGEYDANIVYVPLDDLQRLRGMGDKANVLQIRLTADVRENSKLVHSLVVPEAQKVMPAPEAHAESWWQQQGSLLSAIDIERGLLNLLLFLIIGVAGFGVLAIFSMIVKEKYRDIGVLKSLGASGGGVMGIFLGYGLLLGLVGGLLGTGLGVWITLNINDIEKAITAMTGHEVFDRKVYSFDQIPTHLDAVSVTLVNVGAVGIAVASAVWPAFCAARLQPVRALRFE